MNIVPASQRQQGTIQYSIDDEFFCVMKSSSKAFSVRSWRYYLHCQMMYIIPQPVFVQQEEEADDHLSPVFVLGIDAVLLISSKSSSSNISAPLFSYVMGVVSDILSILARNN